MMRWPTAEEEALFWREIARRQAHPYTRRLTVTAAMKPSAAVLHEAQPRLLYGWDATAGTMLCFDYVGAPVGSVVNPTVP